jgi:hypothetical protein
MDVSIISGAIDLTAQHIANTAQLANQIACQIAHLIRSSTTRARDAAPLVDGLTSRLRGE